MTPPRALPNDYDNNPDRWPAEAIDTPVRVTKRGSLTWGRKR
jgi:hypothetical protein